jgi:SAM-dependent methyltransferase
MFSWFDDHKAFATHFEHIRAMADAAEAGVYLRGHSFGWCSICGKESDFTLRRVKDWTSLRERFICQSCHMNGRSRMVMNLFTETEPAGRFLMLERVTPFFVKVQERYPFVEGCEFFGADIPSGEVRMMGNISVRHENLLALSFASNTLNYLYHGDVLEHIPDIRQGLSECYRVLSDQGTMVFTCPVVDREHHIVRCVVENGQLKHLLPPGYHGNPMDPKGSLVFTEPSWQVLDDLKEAGFPYVQVGLLYDPYQGILRDGNPYAEYNMPPVVFRASKRPL